MNRTKHPAGSITDVAGIEVGHFTDPRRQRRDAVAGREPHRIASGFRAGGHRARRRAV